MKSIIRELRIRWHRWRMEETYNTDRDACRYHASIMVMLIKARS